MNRVAIASLVGFAALGLACGSGSSSGTGGSNGSGGAPTGSGGASAGGATGTGGGAAGSSGAGGSATGGNVGTGGAAGSGGHGGGSGSVGTGGGAGSQGGAGGAAGKGGAGGATGKGGAGGATGKGGAGGGAGNQGGAGGGAGHAGTSGGGGAAGGRAGAGGVVGTGGAGGGHKSCGSDTDCGGFKCCGGLCVNPNNDILNCGGCNKPCPSSQQYCLSGTCQAPPCSGGTNTCGGGGVCCENSCCAAGQLCCSVNMGVSVIGCFDPVDGTCPTGCAACTCAAPTTPIATPSGERPISELKVGDLVYSIDRGELAVVPVASVHRQPVTSAHRMVELRLSHVTLLLSPGHPTSDGRTFGALAAGDRLDGAPVLGARLVLYDQPFTYDILPASDTGTYLAGGVLVGSTLAPARPGSEMSDVAKEPGRRASLTFGAPPR